jgi:crotonobetainyl-CoA:carnitine CoA-transferase CaiB-like acyl-CoA transferase
LTPYQVFDCADGFLIVATGNDAQYHRFCGILGLEGLAQAPDYRSNADRVRNRDALAAALSAATRGWEKAALLAACEGAGVPAGPINDMAEAFDDPQVRARGMQLELDGTPGLRSPFVIDGVRLASPRPAPVLGAGDRE